MCFDGPDQCATDPFVAVVAIHDQAGKPWRQVVRRFQFVANQQACANRYFADPGHKRRLEAVPANSLRSPAASSSGVLALPSKKAATRNRAIASTSLSVMGSIIGATLASVHVIKVFQKQNRRDKARRFET